MGIVSFRRECKGLSFERNTEGYENLQSVSCAKGRCIL